MHHDARPAWIRARTCCMLPMLRDANCSGPWRRPIAGALLLAAATALTGCSPRMALLQGVANELASQGQLQEEDLGLARDAAAFYLKLSESVLMRTPGHLELAASVAGGFTQYAYAFVAFDADRLDGTDTRAALLQRQRAARLYARAQRHGLSALEQSLPGFGKALAAQTPPPLPAEAVGVAYWAAAAWGAQIALSKDSPETVADLPLAIRLAELAYAVNPDHAQGALAVLLAQFELARPGVPRRDAEARAQDYLMRAERAAGGTSAAVLLARAEGLAEPAGDRTAFEALLRQALAVAAGRPDLASQVLRARAQWLLDTVDDRF